VNRSLTAVPGLEVGHATAGAGGTGCTVILGPLRAVAEVRGLATGSRELGTLSPGHLVPRADALLLTGGSAFGLAAADGVMRWLAARGRGYDTGVTRVPIVPAAVLFDLAEGVEPPGPELGEAACEAASRAPVAEGRVGAGAGARVGKLAGAAASMPGGLGSWSVPVGPWTVGALAAVNALGDVLDGEGRIVAGARGADGAFLDGAARARAGAGDRDAAAGEMGDLAGGTHTTLAVVATDAPLDRRDLGRAARVIANAFARRIHPVHTPFDGDVLFVGSTAGFASGAGDRPEGDAPGGLPSTGVLAVAVAAQEALEEAITRSVITGNG
jgi:L-aminopeptidase/D-esterase-like protein